MRNLIINWTWRSGACKCLQFHYWFLTLKLELDALIVIRAIRGGHFKLYIDEDKHHHENKTSVQKSFFKDIWSMVEVMNELGNPFMKNSQDLLVLDTKDIAPTSVVDTIRKIEKIGKTQYENIYIEDRLIKRTVPIFEPIKKNAMALFRTPHGKTVSAMKNKIRILKVMCRYFQDCISCQTRGGDLEDVFAHENNINPPALSQHWKMRLGTKSDLLSKCLEPLTTTTGDAPEVRTLLKTNTKITEAEILPPKRKMEQNRLQNNRSRHSFVLWMAAFESSRTRSVLINISFKTASCLSPVTIRAKILIQELWKCGLDWDELIPDNLKTTWTDLTKDLEKAIQFTIPRYYFSKPSTSTELVLHVFTDASPKAYGAAAYLSNENETTLVMAKTRVAPVKCLTLPQLELMAAIIGARLAAHLHSTLNYPKIVFWSDSSIVLHWLTSTKTLKRFIANRVKEIKY
ncbi:unnamed protein product [Mytilus edulis]|uniref:Uncharacterized protein n=1 Tax=Mytilus edulis TaxID=6550 RepID=A0A8S3ULS7_MYTED|nr:unnamed protein product [Mytilus edulis]